MTGITTDEFCRQRPFVFHVTARENAAVLRSTRRIDTTLSLLEAAGRLDLAGSRRIDYLTLALKDGQVVLKDQKPLIPANTQLEGGWAFEDFVRYLNGLTYFWPGNEHSPIGAGRRLLDHYEADGPLVLRIPTRDLLDVNSGLEPLFSPFNSGAPRYHSGKRAKRGADVFKVAAEFPRRASEVVELAFAGNTVLPDSTVFRAATHWARFFTSAI
jgi:hypothetical protein